MSFASKVLSFFYTGKKPEITSVPVAVAVRNALHVCVDGYDITNEQFEALFCAILEDEIYARRGAAELIEKFFRDHGIKRKL